MYLNNYYVMNSVTCKTIAKIGAQKATKPFRIMVLGQSAVGKSGNYFIINLNTQISIFDHKLITEVCR